MFTSILFNSAGNLVVLFIVLLLIALQWFIFFADSIFQKIGFKSTDKQTTKVPIISGVVSPHTISKALQTINASDPSSTNYLPITPSYNQSQGLTFSLSLWLNIDSQNPSKDIEGKVIFYKGSPNLTQKLQFKNSQGLFHIDVSISRQIDSNSKTFFLVSPSNPSDSVVVNLINAINKKIDPVKYIILIFDLDNFYSISYNSNSKSFSLYSKVNPPTNKDLSSFKVLKFAAYSNIQDVQNRKDPQTNKIQKPYVIGDDYPFKTPLLRFGEKVTDLLFEFNDSTTLNSYSYHIFDKNSQPYTLKFNQFFHLAITVSDNIDSSSKKRTGTIIKFFIDGKLYNSKILDDHIHFNYGNFYIFPNPEKDDKFPNVQLADLTYYRQVLTPATIRSIFKAKYSTKIPTVQQSSKKNSDDVKLYTQNYNNT